jgi:hypothetical protein
MARRTPPEMRPEDALTYEPTNVFVPYGESRQDTAILLVGTAQEFGLPQRDIRSDRSRGGFWITDRLADIVYDGGDEDEESSPETPDATATGSTTK